MSATEQAGVRPPAPPSGPGIALFDVFVYLNKIQDHWIGCAGVDSQAVALAGAWLTVAQELYPTKSVGVGVVDTVKAAVIAYIGWETPGLTR